MHVKLFFELPNSSQKHLSNASLTFNRVQFEPQLCCVCYCIKHWRGNGSPWLLMHLRIQHNMHRKRDKNLEKRKIKPARSTSGLNNRLHLFDTELNKLKGLTCIINTGGKKSMSVNVIETDTINIVIEAICISDCWHFKATLSCHSLHFQKVSAVYRCLTYRRTALAFCLAEGENDTGIVDRYTHRVKGKEMVLTLRFSTFICGYRTQQGFKAVTFFWQAFTADVPYTQESVHPKTTQQQEHLHWELNVRVHWCCVQFIRH